MKKIFKSLLVLIISLLVLPLSVFAAIAFPDKYTKDFKLVSDVDVKSLKYQWVKYSSVDYNLISTYENQIAEKDSLIAEKNNTIYQKQAQINEYERFRSYFFAKLRDVRTYSENIKYKAEGMERTNKEESTVNSYVNEYYSMVNEVNGRLEEVYISYGNQYSDIFSQYPGKNFSFLRHNVNVLCEGDGSNRMCRVADYFGAIDLYNSDRSKLSEYISDYEATIYSKLLSLDKDITTLRNEISQLEAQKTELNNKITAEKTKNYSVPANYITVNSGDNIATITEAGKYKLYVVADGSSFSKIYSVTAADLEAENQEDTTVTSVKGNDIYINNGERIKLSDLSNVEGLVWTIDNNYSGTIENGYFIPNLNGTAILSGKTTKYEYTVTVYISKKVNTDNEDISATIVTGDPTKTGDDFNVTNIKSDVVEDEDIKDNIVGDKPDNIKKVKVIILDYKDNNNKSVTPNSEVNIGIKIPDGWTNISVYQLTDTEGNPVNVTDYTGNINNIKNGDKLAVKTGTVLNLNEAVLSCKECTWTVTPSEGKILNNGELTIQAPSTWTVTGTDSNNNKVTFTITSFDSYDNGIIKRENGITYITKDKDISNYNKTLVESNVIGDKAYVNTNNGGTYLLAETNKANSSWDYTENHSDSGTTDNSKTGAFVSIIVLMLLVISGVAIRLYSYKNKKIYNV